MTRSTARTSDNGPTLGAFLALTFGLSWSLWAASTAFDTLRTPLFIAGGFGPTLAALVLLSRRPDDRSRVFRHLVAWRFPGWIYLGALGLAPVGIALSLWLAHGLGVGSGDILPDAMPAHLPLLVFAYVLVFSVAGEELGWRGIALPHLLARHGPIVASLVIGAVWALWHAPLFVLPGNFHADIPPLLFALQVIASSFLYTHFHLASGGSLVPAHLFHASFNTSVGLFPILPQTQAGSAAPLAIAVCLLAVMAGVSAIILSRRA